MPRISSADANTLVARGLIEALHNPVQAALFATLNDTQHAEL